MRDRGTLYVGLLLVLFGAMFLFVSLGQRLLGLVGIEAGWGRLWPLLVLFVGLAFWLPLAIWWPHRGQVAGLVVPATIITINGLLLLYQSLTGDWRSWAYAWALEPISVALGLLALYFLTDRPKGLLLAVAIVGGIGLMCFLVFASAFGGAFRVLGPAVVVAVGVFFVLRGLGERRSLPRE